LGEGGGGGFGAGQEGAGEEGGGVGEHFEEFVGDFLGGAGDACGVGGAGGVAQGNVLECGEGAEGFGDVLEWEHGGEFNVKAGRDEGGERGNGRWRGAKGEV